MHATAGPQGSVIIALLVTWRTYAENRIGNDIGYC